MMLTERWNGRPEFIVELVCTRLLTRLLVVRLRDVTQRNVTQDLRERRNYGTIFAIVPPRRGSDVQIAIGVGCTYTCCWPRRPLRWMFSRTVTHNVVLGYGCREQLDLTARIYDHKYKLLDVLSSPFKQNNFTRLPRKFRSYISSLLNLLYYKFVFPIFIEPKHFY